VNLADRVAQLRSPFAVEDCASGRVTLLNGAAEFAALVAACPIRYVLADDLTRLCTELAYSRGARHLACADLLHVPAQLLWVEWSSEPWHDCLERYGFPVAADPVSGRRGVLIRASADGRRGMMRTLWSDAGELGVLASSIECYFDLDTAEGEEPQPPDSRCGAPIRVYDRASSGDDVLARCFRFRFERSWSQYYECARLSPQQTGALRQHALGTIAIDIPVVLTFLLLLASRAGLPRHPHDFARLNRARARLSRPPLLAHIEVRAPLLPEYLGYARAVHGAGTRRGPRLHHVRGHLMRSGSHLVWRVPHLRGSARAGAIRARTVTWTFDKLAETERGSAALAPSQSR
jgi:hypothetical protein